MMIGTWGAILLTLSGLPQAWQCYRTGNSDGLSWGLLGMWLAGEVLMLTYALVEYAHDWRLLLNYGGNAAIVYVMLHYKVWPRREG